MMGYVPQIFPQSYIQTRNAFSGFGNSDVAPPPPPPPGMTYSAGPPTSAPPMVSAVANSSSGAGGMLSFVGNLLGGAFQSGDKSSQTFYALQQQMDAERLAEQRSRRWGAFGAVVVGIAGLAGVVYLLRK